MGTCCSRHCSNVHYEKPQTPLWRCYERQIRLFIDRIQITIMVLGIRNYLQKNFYSSNFCFSSQHFWLDARLSCMFSTFDSISYSKYERSIYCEQIKQAWTMLNHDGSYINILRSLIFNKWHWWRSTNISLCADCGR